jgi:hypothetical protein
MKNTKVVNCKFFKSCGNPFGGCKNEKVHGACLHEYIQQCEHSERKYKLKRALEKTEC